MTFELWTLVGAIALGFVQIGGQSFALKADAGNAYTVGPRDNPVRTSERVGRFQRALRNFNESFAFFAAAVLVVHQSGSSGVVSQIGAGLYLLSRILYVPAYVFHIPGVRTALWQVSMGGIVLVLLQLALS